MEGMRVSMIILLIIQLILLILSGVLLRYGSEADPKSNEASKAADSLAKMYSMFQNVHVMIFIGFGYLMTFLKKYGYSSVGFTFLLGAVIVQWAIFCQGFFDLTESHDYKIHVDLLSLVNADIATAAVLISMGAVLGRTSPIQLIIMGIIEMVLFATNEYILVHYLKISDLGGSIVVHTFGAYFGLAVSTVLRPPKKEGPEGASYTSDLFATIGSVFLWMFWPSFNAVLSDGDGMMRAVVNTYLAIAASCVVAFALSGGISSPYKFDMVHVQNATLAGGVAVGTSADLLIEPVGAVSIGFIAGVVSVFGFKFLQPFLNEKLTIHDTCGVNNLHGMPGILAGLFAIIASSMATEENYGLSLYTIFPARAPAEGSAKYKDLLLKMDIKPGDDRTAGMQAVFQLAAIPCTLAIAIVGGIITGTIIKFLSNYTGSLEGKECFHDIVHWEIPDVEEVEDIEIEKTKSIENHETIKKTEEEKCQ